MGAFVIGIAAGIVCYWGVTGLKHFFGYDDALDAFGGCAVQSLAHENRMELEMVVGHSDQIDQRVNAAACRTDGSRIIGIPGDDLGARIRPVRFLELSAIASDKAKEPVRRDCRNDAVSDCASRAEEG
jgi:hypothetical protein